MWPQIKHISMETVTYWIEIHHEQSNEGITSSSLIAMLFWIMRRLKYGHLLLTNYLRVPTEVYTGKEQFKWLFFSHDEVLYSSKFSPGLQHEDDKGGHPKALG